MSGGTPATKATNADCPRCGQPFRCGAADAHCPCFELQLGPALREQIRRAHGDGACLCVSCLLALQQQQAQQQAQQ
ncbi:MAG: cysteine-rich CWC family protein [Burkholderiaceae bacterium]